jgi:hypothetical protein
LGKYSYIILDKQTSIVESLQDTPYAVIREAIINVKYYSNLLDSVFRDCLEKYKDKTFRHYAQLLFLLNKDFACYNIVFKDSGNLRVDKSDKEEVGIEQMKTNRHNLEITIECNYVFGERFLQQDNFLIYYFNTLLGHELVHRGQALNTNADTVLLIAKKEIERCNKLKDKYERCGYNDSEINDLLYKEKYLANRREIMSYAYQAVEELRYSNYSNEEIKAKLRTFDFNKYEKESGMLESYFISFRDYRTNKLSYDVLKLFSKYMLEYINGNGKELTKVMR